MKERVVLAAFALLAAVAVGAGAQAKPLKIQAEWGYWNDQTPPVDRTLTDYATKLIIDRTGVDAEWPLYPQDWTPTQFWQNVTAAGTVPEVLDQGALWTESASAQFVTKNNLIREITPDMVKKYMPNYAARALKYGRTVEELLNANKYQGRFLSIPQNFAFAAFPKLADNPAAQETVNDYQSLAFRDDVLKKIFPSALSEFDLQAKLVRNGKLTMDDLTGDIPIKNLDDLYNYLKAVKGLNLKVGDKPLIPGALTPSSEGPGALDGSLRTILGYFWNYPFMDGTPPDFSDSVYPKATAEYRAYLQWWCKLYNEGLLDPDIFVMSNEQLAAKQANGEYAVINRHGSVEEARKVGRDSGYGFRFFPLFYGQWKRNLMSNYIRYVSLGGSPVAITTSVKTADVPKVLKWIDWYMSEERDNLAYWGMPAWYRGTGRDRRYLPAYAILEDWTLYGINSSHDGAYYGLETTFADKMNPVKDVKFPLGPMGFFNDQQTYPDAPYFVYPKNIAKALKTVDVWSYQERVMQDARYRELSLFTTADNPSPAIMALPDVAAWDAASKDPSIDAATVKLVTGPMADFETNYQGFIDLIMNAGGPNGTQKALDAERKFMQSYWKSDIVPKTMRR